jgi:hypothetical protein
MSDRKRETEIPAIGSAVLNIGTAANDCASAREAWIEESWGDAVMWINCAIAQLESARAKIKAHAAKPKYAQEAARNALDKRDG